MINERTEWLTADEFQEVFWRFNEAATGITKSYERLEYHLWRSLRDFVNVNTSDVIIHFKEDAVYVVTENSDYDVFDFDSDTSFGAYLWDNVQDTWCDAVYRETKSDKENDNMNKMFSNFEFGTCENDKIRMSPYGLAVQNSGNWVSYDAATGRIVNVEILNFDGGKYLYKMPVAISAVEVGDIIIHCKKPMFVVEILKDSFRAVDPVAGEEKVILPQHNVFGFDFVTKIVSLFNFGNGFNASAEQPFGNILPFMLMSETGASDTSALAMAMMMGNADGNFNPMMFYMLANDKSNDNLLPMMLMMNPNFKFGGSTANSKK